jgi:hypothetical protein
MKILFTIGKILINKVLFPNPYFVEDNENIRFRETWTRHSTRQTNLSFFSVKSGWSSFRIEWLLLSWIGHSFKESLCLLSFCTMQCITCAWDVKLLLVWDEFRDKLLITGHSSPSEYVLLVSENHSCVFLTKIRWSLLRKMWEKNMMNIWRRWGNRIESLVFNFHARLTPLRHLNEKMLLRDSILFFCLSFLILR